MRNLPIILIAILAIGVGIYPALYLLLDMSGGLLGTKPESVLESRVWNIAFYQHILLGGVAMLIGWPQFITRLRNRYLRLHRTLGKVYIVACLLSGCAALYIAAFATGGIIATLGFGGLAIAWIYSTLRAYFSIRAGQLEAHRAWMTRSYALTFAAVTLRIWLPLFQFALGIEFITAYVIISWLCWVPNLLVAEWIIRRYRPALHPTQA